jgi:serine protease AprX
VANFSLEAAGPSTFLYDPLDKAVERLWQAGIVVVVAAGNGAVNGQPNGVQHAPANDPFVITVGAVDVNGTRNASDDRIAPWSNNGFTYDGFRKPDLSAPGRYMVGGAPKDSTLSEEGGQDPSLVAEDLLKLSGTSFSAPIVSAAAAGLLAVHPDWTPDQVKGALMVSTTPLPNIAGWAGGVGELNMQKAFDVRTPPNPNLALNSYLVNTSSGRVFNAQAWVAAATNASWSSASWSSASWSSASWSTASWSSASWSSASWSSASWTSASWTSAVQTLVGTNKALEDLNGDG